jgi:hypothetical protein
MIAAAGARFIVAPAAALLPRRIRTPSMASADLAHPHAYHVFGMTLVSDLAFPELQAAGASPDASWRLRVAAGEAPARALVPCGAEGLPGDLTVRLGVDGTCHRIAYDDTGIFDVDAGDRSITWYARPGVAEEAVRIDVLSRVLAVALHADGHFCLHASAARVDEGAIGFLAPKGTGKSTLAVALARAGAPLLADDALAIHTGVTALVAPGVRSVRLWDDSLRRLALAGHDAPAPIADAPPRKHLLCALDDRLVAERPARLDALYVLRPAAADAVEPAWRARVSPVHAAVLMAAQAKLGALAGGALAGSVLAHATALARAVPVYVLHVARDLDRLDDAVQTILGWHGGVLAAGGR